MKIVKIINSIILGLLLVCIFGCTNKDTKININIKNISFNDNTESITVSGNISVEEINKKESIENISIKYYYDNEEIKTLNILYNNEFSFSINNIEEDDYTKTLYFDICVNTNQNTYNSDKISKNIYNMALEYSNISSFALKIINTVEIIKLNSINLNVDYYKSDVKTDDMNYKIVFYSFDNDFVIFKIKLNDKVVLNENYNFTINNKTVYENIVLSDNDTLITYTEKSKYIYSINENIDYTKTEFKKETEKYIINYNNDFQKIQIQITLIDYNYGYNIELKFNNIVINNKLYSIKENVLTYESDDPNWSPIY